MISNSVLMIFTTGSRSGCLGDASPYGDVDAAVFGVLAEMYLTRRTRYRIVHEDGVYGGITK